MSTTRRSLIAAATAAVALPPGRARTAGAPTIRIGIMTASWGGLGPTCARQAVQEFTGGKDFSVEVLEANHKNKADTALGIARQWFEQDGVDAIVDVPISAMALPVSALCREKNKALLVSDVGSTDLTGAQCSPTTIQWTYDTYMLAKSTGGAVVKAGGDTWFFIVPDNLASHQLQRDTTRVVTEAGGKVLGGAVHPLLSTTDFSEVLRQAQQSGAKVLALASFGDDLANTLKQARAMNMHKAMRFAGLNMDASDVHDTGLEATQGLLLTASFYWDLNERTRAFMDRIRLKAPKAYPGQGEAGNYSGTLHYLKAVADMGVPAAKADGAAVIARMKKMPTDDDCFGHGYIREDGRKMHQSYLFQVKTPAESKGDLDLLKLVATTPAEQAFRPLSEGGCPLVRT
jgi:branched-chain amino acid transport system substrate-binding protein